MPKFQETPTTVLRTLMDEYQISVNKLAALTKMGMSTVRNITMGKGSFTPATALRLAKLFGTTPEYWLDIQTRAELVKVARDPEVVEALKDIAKAVKPAPAKTPASGKTAAAKVATVKGAKIAAAQGAKTAAAKGAKAATAKGVKAGESPAAKPKKEAKPQKAAAPKETGRKAAVPKTGNAVKAARKPGTKKA
jgi:addiction module HigA family antidote